MSSNYTVIWAMRVQNLIGNAIKYSREGVPPVIRIFADSDRGEDASADGVAANTSRITVEDNGLGFEAQYAERIFGIFQRLHGRGRYEGTGVGLAICLRIAERHGGTITATGRPGQGATFTVNLKTRQDSSSPSAAETGIAA